MNNVHGTHGTTGIVKHPFLLLIHELAGNLLVQLGDNVVDDAARIIAMGANGSLGEIMQVAGFEDVELVETSVEIGVEGREKGENDGEDGEAAHGAATARGLLGGLRFGHFQID